jgi:hypothetical protein
MFSSFKGDITHRPRPIPTDKDSECSGVRKSVERDGGGNNSSILTHAQVVEVVHSRSYVL